jgi:hypothetical protein
VADPFFYIFTDDPVWVKNNFVLNSSNILIDFKFGSNSYIDMQLMSQCKHNIIANSSFSWWGAWLNDNPKKNCSFS